MDIKGGAKMKYEDAVATEINFMKNGLAKLISQHCIYPIKDVDYLLTVLQSVDKTFYAIYISSTQNISLEHSVSIILGI